MQKLTADNATNLHRLDILERFFTSYTSVLGFNMYRLFLDIRDKGMKNLRYFY